jgi:NADPH:quinone reductase-like Zn-dependent oxidoreductase
MSWNGENEMESSNDTRDGDPATTSGRPSRAIVYDRYGSPDVLELREVEVPVPSEGQVLVRVRAASVNPLDWHRMRGLPYVIRLGEGLTRPKRGRLGADLAGMVEAFGENVTRFRPGDEVFGMSIRTLADHVAVAEVGLAAKPANLTFEQAAAVPVAGLTALQGCATMDVFAPATRC